MGGEAGQSEMAEVPLGPGRRNARERLVGGEGERLGQPRPRQSGRQSLLIESALEAHLRPLPSIPPPPLTDLKATVVSLDGAVDGWCTIEADVQLSLTGLHLFFTNFGFFITIIFFGHSLARRRALFDQMDARAVMLASGHWSAPYAEPGVTRWLDACKVGCCQAGGLGVSRRSCCMRGPCCERPRCTRCMCWCTILARPQGRQAPPLPASLDHRPPPPCLLRRQRLVQAATTVGQRRPRRRTGSPRGDDVERSPGGDAAKGKAVEGGPKKSPRRGGAEAVEGKPRGDGVEGNLGRRRGGQVPWRATWGDAMEPTSVPKGSRAERVEERGRPTLEGDGRGHRPPFQQRPWQSCRSQPGRSSPAPAFGCGPPT